VRINHTAADEAWAAQAFADAALDREMDFRAAESLAQSRYESGHLL
jgi:hypothetical protein